MSLLRARRQNGFTLAELLIVIAIIAVLTAIAIPIFTTQLSHAKEVACQANRRALLGELSDRRMLEGGLTQAEAEQILSDYGRLCPGGGTVTVAVEGEAVTIRCDVHGATSAGGNGATTGDALAASYLQKFETYVADNQATYHNNTGLRDAFAKAGNSGPMLVVNNQKYPVEPYYSQSSGECWLFARVSGGTGWMASYLYNPQNGIWYEPLNYNQTQTTSRTITFSSVKALNEAVTAVVKRDGWRAVASYELVKS